MKNNKKLLLIIIVTLVIVIFLSTFIVSGCGRRAKVIAALEKARQSEEQDSQSQTETISENEKSDTEETVKESIEDKETAETEESTNIDEPAENEDIDTSESEETIEDEETTSTESDEETTEEEGTEYTADMPYIATECANIYGGRVYVDELLLPGDNGQHNHEVRGFISFDISELSGATIQSAKISGKSSTVYGTPINTYGPMIIKAVYWGARAVSLEDFNLDGIEITNISKNNFGKSPEVLQEDLQNVVNSGSNRYQLCFYFEMPPQADGDGEVDDIQYPLEDIDLSVTYSK